MSAIQPPSSRSIASFIPVSYNWKTASLVALAILVIGAIVFRFVSLKSRVQPLTLANATLESLGFRSEILNTVILTETNQQTQTASRIEYRPILQGLLNEVKPGGGGILTLHRPDLGPFSPFWAHLDVGVPGGNYAAASQSEKQQSIVYQFLDQLLDRGFISEFSVDAEGNRIKIRFKA